MEVNPAAPEIYSLLAELDARQSRDISVCQPTSRMHQLATLLQSGPTFSVFVTTLVIVLVFGRCG